MRQKKIWLAVAFALGFFAVGVPYWLIPYGSVNLPDALVAPGLFVVVFGAFVLRAYAVSSIWKITGILGAVMPSAVMARVIVDGLQDPTSHNLWPFEVAIALIMGIACAFAGAIAGGLLRKTAHYFGRGE